MMWERLFFRSFSSTSRTFSTFDQSNEFSILEYSSILNMRKKKKQAFHWFINILEKVYLVNLTNILPFTERNENFLEILSKKVLIRNSQNQDILVKAYILLQHHHWLTNLPSRPVKNKRRQDILVKIASNVRGFWWFVMFCWVAQKLEFIR